MTRLCPTDMVDAPVEVVWDLLTHPADWDKVFDVRVCRVSPPGPARVGQRVDTESGPRLLHLRVRFDFNYIDEARHRLGLTVSLPLGVSVSEDLVCSALDATHCRVVYGCDFSFSRGWRGAVAGWLMRREIQVGPADSLARLKSAAERTWSATVSKTQAG